MLQGLGSFIFTAVESPVLADHEESVRRDKAGKDDGHRQNCRQQCLRSRSGPNLRYCHRLSLNYSIGKRALTHSKAGIEVRWRVPNVATPDIGGTSNGVDQGQSGCSLRVRPSDVKRERVVNKQLRHDYVSAELPDGLDI